VFKGDGRKVDTMPMGQWKYSLRQLW